MEDWRGPLRGGWAGSSRLRGDAECAGCAAALHGEQGGGGGGTLGLTAALEMGKQPRRG